MLRRYYGKISKLPIDEFVGHDGELVVDDITGKVYVMDGVTYGGTELVGAMPRYGTSPPDNPTPGALWYDPNSGRTYIYFQSTWVDAAPNTVYSLPEASDTVLGGVKVDNETIVINGQGVISAIGDGFISNRLINGDKTLSLDADGILNFPNNNGQIGQLEAPYTGLEFRTGSGADWIGLSYGEINDNNTSYFYFDKDGSDYTTANHLAHLQLKNPAHDGHVEWRFDSAGSLAVPTVSWNYVARTFSNILVTYGETYLTFTVLPDNSITDMKVAAGAGGYGPGSVDLTVPGTNFPGGTTPENDIVFNVETFPVPDFPSTTSTDSAVSYVSGTLPARYDNIASTGDLGLGSGLNHWVFGMDGGLTVPGAIQSTSGTLTLSADATHPELAWTINSGSNYSVLSSPINDDSHVGGISLQGTQGGGQIYWFGNVEGIPVANTLVIVSNTLDYKGNVAISTDVGMWNFGYEGNLTLPASGSINYSNGASILDGIATNYSLPVANASTLGGIKLGEGFSKDGSDKVTTNKLYSTNESHPAQHYRLTLDTNGVVHLPDESIINGATLQVVPGTGELNYAALAAGPDSNHPQKTWIWADAFGASISTDSYISNHLWQFDNSGNVTLPESGSINYSNGMSILEGITSGSVPSTTPPTDPIEGQLWYDTDSGRIYVYLGDSWVDASPPLASNIYDNSNVAAYLPSDTTIILLKSNARTQANSINTLTANASAQQVEIRGLRANITAANAAIITANSSMKTYVDSVTTAWVANAVIQDSAINDIKANLALQIANAVTQTISLNTLTANASAQETEVRDLRANITAANSVISTKTVYSNSNVSAYLTTYSGSIGGSITVGAILQAPQHTKASNATGTVGQICWDSNYIYVCTATNTWKRVALTGGY